MSNAIKQVRGQLRQITKEIMPQLIATELYAELQRANAAKLDEIAKNVQETLKRIDERQKDVYNMILRDVYANKTQAVVEPVKNDTNETGKGDLGEAIGG